MVSDDRRIVHVSTGGVQLEGALTVPDDAIGVVLFAHGSGSSRHSKRNNYVASVLNDGGLATLLIDLLTAEEEKVDNLTRRLRFDIPMLAERLVGACRWLAEQPDTADLPIGLFGASTGGGAALVAAAEVPGLVGAVVSRGGRPDLAGEALPAVQAPTLLLVGGADDAVIPLNREAMERMENAECELVLIQGATHLFGEPGALEQVAEHAQRWFASRLAEV
jgi:dienelactone hydrolase